MELISFIDAMDLKSKNQLERAKLLCFFQYKEENIEEFSMPYIAELFVNSGYNRPNISILKDKLIKGKGKAMLPSKNKKGSLVFIPTVLQKMDKEVGILWEDTKTIVSEGKLIDESKFCGKRKYLDRLIMQINHSYENNCYDACAVLMRRLFEILIILSFQNFNIDDQIKGLDGNYLELKGLVNKICGNSVLKIGRVRDKFDEIREVGNSSAHGFAYTAGKKDIDDIKHTYRVMLEELYNKSGLIN